MKRFLVVTLLVLLVSGLMAEVMEKAGKEYIPTGNPSGNIAQTRAPGDLTVVVPPVTIRSSYYDYMPGSYCSLPLQIQTDETGNVLGAYLAYHSTETSTATRRVYLAHIDGVGNIDFNSYCNTNDIREGYPGLDLDPVTNDPMVAWHVDFNEDTHYDIGFVYDQYHFLPGPGLLAAPFAIIDNYSLFQQGTLEFEDDEFIWPQVYVVKGPTFETDGKRRIYVEGNNFASHGSAGSASENVLITWADFTTADIEAGNFPNLDWHYVTVPELDGYNKDEPYWGRMQKGIAVSDDGKIAIFGFLSINADDDPDDIDELVCFYNENWCEDDGSGRIWETARTPSGFYVDNPLNEDGTRWLTNSEGTPAEDVYFDHGALCSHPNAFFDSIGRVHLIGSQILLYVDPDDPASSFVHIYNDYVKSFIFDFDTQEFQINDLYPQSANPNDQQAMLPWDLDEDGVVDEYDDDGFVSPVDGWPIWWQAYDVAFHENSFKVVGNKDDELMIAVWQDGLKNKYFAEGGDPDYEDWNEIAEIAISYSTDNGDHWSAPMFMNSKSDDENYFPELDGVKPCYVYPGDVIERVDENNSIVHLMFYDDNSFGSFIQGNGQDIGGDVKYMAVQFEHEFVALPGAGDVDSNVANANTSLSINTFPNPFNPTTAVSYTPSQAGNVNVSVYNVKGELVKTLVNEYQTSTPQTIIWNGDDSAGNKAATGVYFFKVNTKNDSAVSKALMLK